MNNLVRKYSLEEFEELQKVTGSRLEFWHGLIVDMGMPGEIHNTINTRILGDFDRYFRGKQCKVLFNQEVKFSDSLIVVPDLIVFCDKSRSDGKRYYGAPDLVVEIWSPGNNEKRRDDKTILYSTSGVKEIWLADPAARRTVVSTLNLDTNTYNLAIFGFNDVWKSCLFEGLETSMEGIEFDWEQSGY